MGRDKTKPVVHYAPLSGALGGELKKHAYERCRHFFFYEFYLKALVDYLNAVHGQTIRYENALLVKASHQIDDGFRAKVPVYSDFDETSPDVLHIPCTAFRNVDAAHFCNLGVTQTFMDLAAGFSRDVKALDLYERLKAMMGNTRWLPQRVNIGPDRVIDTLHGDLALEMIVSTRCKLIGMDNICTYLERAVEVMTAYQQTQTKSGRDGVAACAQCYLDTYRQPGMAERMYGDVHRAVAGDCWGLGLPAGDFLD